MRLKLIVGLVAAAGGGGDGGLGAGARSKRPTVAVMDFDYGTVDNWWGQYDIGKGMADQVVDALSTTARFRVIERKKLDTVLAEQDFAQSDRADPSAAKLAKVGKVLGVKYIISGSITKFATEKRAAAACGSRASASAAQEGQERGDLTARDHRRHHRRDPGLGQGRGQSRTRAAASTSARAASAWARTPRSGGNERPRRRPGAGLQRPRARSSSPRRTGSSSAGPQSAA